MVSLQKFSEILFYVLWISFLLFILVGSWVGVIGLVVDWFRRGGFRSRCNCDVTLRDDVG